MRKRIVILGAGITGRLAKILFPEATVLESKKEDDIYTADLGVCISIVPIPELSNIRYTRYIEIDGQKPSLELINKYKKKIAREGDMCYGDFRQFEPEQIVYKQELPQKLDIQYEFEVKKIELSEKTIHFGGGCMLYDYLISTIPLINLVQISDLFTQFQEHTSSFFMHRPIYLLQMPWDTEDGVIRENYITDIDTPIYRENYFQGQRNRESLFKLEGGVKIYPGKIYPNTQVERIVEDLNSYGVYCVGRYATWNNKAHIWNVYSQLKYLREIL